MSQKSKNEYVEKMRLRYQSRGREGKSKLLAQLVEVCGLNRKHAINLMNQPLGSTVGRIKGNPRELEALIGELLASAPKRTDR
jgi:hypothetical protein